MAYQSWAGVYFEARAEREQRMLESSIDERVAARLQNSMNVTSSDIDDALLQKVLTSVSAMEAKMIAMTGNLETRMKEAARAAALEDQRRREEEKTRREEEEARQVPETRSKNTRAAPTQRPRSSNDACEYSALRQSTAEVHTVY